MKVTARSSIGSWRRAARPPHTRTGASPRATPAPPCCGLHGGPATEGIWWHSPGIVSGCSIRAWWSWVEMTTGNRFDKDSDQNTDRARRSNPARTRGRFQHQRRPESASPGFPRRRRALLMATRGAAPAGVEYWLVAAISTAGRRHRQWRLCRSVERHLTDGSSASRWRCRRPGQFSPFAQIRMGLPPVLSIHATPDEFCSLTRIWSGSSNERVSSGTPARW